MQSFPINFGLFQPGQHPRYAPVKGEAAFISTLDKKRFQTLELKRVYQLTETLFEQIDVPTSQTW